MKKEILGILAVSLCWLVSVDSRIGIAGSQENSENYRVDDDESTPDPESVVVDPLGFTDEITVNNDIGVVVVTPVMKSLFGRPLAFPWASVTLGPHQSHTFESIQWGDFTMFPDAVVIDYDASSKLGVASGEVTW